MGATGGAASHEVFWCVQELATAVILDIGCLKSVAGTTWVNQLLNQWQRHDRWFVVEKEREVFRFGDGNTLTSEYGVQLEATFAGRPVILGFSIVKGDCPPLLSRHALTQLGVSFDCERHVLSSKKLEVKSYGLRQTTSGHYVMDIAEFDLDQQPNIPADFRLEAGREACLWNKKNEVLVGQGFGSEANGCAPDLCVAHVDAGQLLPGMRRSRSPHQAVPQHPVRGGGPGTPAERPGHGDGESSKLGRAGGQQCLHEELSAGGTILSEEATEGQGSSIRSRSPARAVPVGPGRDGDHRGGPHPSGDGSHCEVESQGAERACEKGGDQGAHGHPSRLPDSLQQLQRGDRLQHALVYQEQDDQLSVEEVAVAVEGEGCRGKDDARSSLEAQSPMARDAPGQGSGILVGSLRESASADARSHCSSSDVKVTTELDSEENARKGQGEGGFHYIDLEEDVSEDDQGGHTAKETTEDYNLDEGETNYEAYFIEELFVDEEEMIDMYEEHRAVFYQERRAPGTWVETRPPRGLTQQFKKGVQQGRRLMEAVKQGARVNDKFMVLEIFSGSSMLTRTAMEAPGWGAYQPIDVLLGEDGDMSKKPNRERVKNTVRTLKPDLVVITPPCGPWCAWQRLCHDLDNLDEIRKRHLPFWKLAREVWDIQQQAGRLCLTEQPLGSEALETKYMVEREPVEVDQCMFGLKDPVSQLLYRKSTALDVTEQAFAVGLAGVRRCNHQPREHEQIRGSVIVAGRRRQRSELAACWTKDFATYILQAAQKSLAGRPSTLEPPHVLEVSPVDEEGYDILPVEIEEGILTAEEVLKRQLRQMGAEGERYDYIQFEGEARMLPRRTRATLAHLHVALGHLSNDRLHRMVSLAGGSADLLTGIKSLHCQVCQMVRPPGSKPQASYTKPTNFNAKVSGDVFYIWDVKNVKYAVVHYIDELTDYHVGALEFDPSSDWAAETLCRLWYDVFGPPDVLLTDGGSEFYGSVARLNDLFAVQHDIVFEQAKWRLGHVERHGALVKVMMMKVIQELQISKLQDMQCALVSCMASKSRIATKGGVSPLQAVTGRNTSLPGSLLAQVTSGKVKFKTNEMITQDEALRRSERIRSASQEACHWLDAHEGLRRALAARSKPPMMELIREGASVYVYDPPVQRRGLARRLQDNISWSGPAVVVCVERDGTVPKKIWVRLRSRVKAYPLEKIRLATADELLSADYILAALKDMEGELQGGRLQVQDYKPEKGSDKDDEIEKESGQLSAEVERKRELQHDVPEALRPEQEAEVEPHTLPFQKKQRLFEQLAKDLGAPTAMQEAAVRNRLESAYGELKKVRKEMKKEAKDKERQAARGVSVAAGPRTSSKTKGKAELVVENDNDDKKVTPWSTLWSEVETQALLWEAEDESSPWMAQLVEKAECHAEGEVKAVMEAQLVTGKLRVEYQWKNLSEEWRKAYEQPLIKAVKVYFDHDAIQGVSKDAVVDPRKILSSRFVLTNKGGETLMEAELKARWILGGHRDVEAGKFPTLAPTASILAHNILNTIAVQMGWVVQYEDVASAFLQGQRLPASREVYVRMPTGYPGVVTDYLLEQLGDSCRTDLLRLLKGGFGLCESPRLWYLEYKATLKEINLNELKLIPGMFVAFHPDGRLRALVTIHVDDTRYAGDESAQEIWDALHQRLKFGQHRKATDGWQKFCGRYERQDPQTFEFYYTMEDYITKIPEILKEECAAEKGPLTEKERVKIGSILGQVNWAARQGRYDLSYGVSHCQQLAGAGLREAMEWTAKLVSRARKEVEVKVTKLDCDLKEAIVISASDAAYAAQPKEHSQGGVMCLLANPKVLEGVAPVAVLEAQSMKIQRVVRCSMSAELSMAAEAFEHGDFVRAVLAETLFADFEIRRWKWFASRWPHYLVIDAKTGYDVLNSEAMTSDRKIMVDAAVLREALIEEGTANYVRWIPGREMVSDGLTKWSDNGVLLQVLREGRWSLVDNEEAQRLRREAAERKKRYVHGRAAPKTPTP